MVFKKIILLLLFISIKTFAQESKPNDVLENRNQILKKLPQYTCNEEGLVVVEIIVDKKGTVIDAHVKEKESTSTAECLKKEAIKAAYNTRWSPCSTCNEKQIGTVRYNFSLKD